MLHPWPNLGKEERNILILQQQAVGANWFLGVPIAWQTHENRNSVENGCLGDHPPWAIHTSYLDMHLYVCNTPAPLLQQLTACAFLGVR